MITTAENAIETIEKAKSSVDLVGDGEKWEQVYKDLVKMIHPDICKLSGAVNAMSKLNQFKDQLSSGQNHSDEAGKIIYWPNKFQIEVENKHAAIASIDNYNRLKGSNLKSTELFKKYIPAEMKVAYVSTQPGARLEGSLLNRALPLSSLGTLPQEHVNWILNRMLEFAVWVNNCGYVHCGINPESVYVVPETHGIIVTSFYHMMPLNKRVRTICGNYKNFYPVSLFTDKQAVAAVDIELCKRTAIYLLGDKSGIGTKLRKTHNLEFLNFLQKQHDAPFKTLDEYRSLLAKHFDTKKFHKLNV